MTSLTSLFFRFVATFTVFLTVALAQAADTRTYLKTGPSSATVNIKTDEADYVQAADYVDALENAAFIDMMLADAQSDLAKTKAQLELDICGETSKVPDGWIPMCGRVEISNLVRISFGRGGWMSAGASYAFFVGFRSEGSGHFLESYYMVNIAEQVEANVDAQMHYAGSLTKSLSLEKIVALPPQ